MISTEKDIQSSFAILELVEGEWLARMIQVITRLGLPNLLEQGPKGLADLAATIGTHERTLYRILRALSSRGIFQLDENMVVSHTPLSRALVMQEDSIAPMVVMFGDNWLRAMWDGLEHSLRTGEPGFNFVHDNQDIFTYCNQHPEALRSFQAGMTSFSSMVNAPIAKSYNFDQFERLVDVGGGRGSLLMSILRAYPSLGEGILFDLPRVIEQVQVPSDLGGRMELQAGDFFKELPSADGYIMKQVLHDWNDDSCIAILQRCRHSLRPGGKILVADRVVSDEGAFSSFNKVWDVLMSTVVGGQERRGEDFRRIFEGAGLRLTRIIETGTPISLVEGCPS